ncbi:hypothetical protein LJC42_07235 [Eubacteriales bacterium OttesenSCG-928-K08]|nr:hypothetical protein [Eubacteriales bacterium OttesenSCG-928-K08]
MKKSIVLLLLLSMLLFCGCNVTPTAAGHVTLEPVTSAYVEESLPKQTEAVLPEPVQEPAQTAKITPTPEKTPEEEAAQLAIEYAKLITGWDFSEASVEAVLFEDYFDNRELGEWFVEIIGGFSPIPGISMRFSETNGLTFFALNVDGFEQGEYMELPLIQMPEDIRNLNGKELALYWYEALPIHYMDEIKKVEISDKNITNWYTGHTLTKTKLRLMDGSVLTSYFDEETGRPTYFCLYTSDTL